ncbi:MAG: hypothetical protein RQM90_11165 [Methanoculleus sp.]
MSRVSDSLTHNIHQGGIGAPVTIDEDMRSIAEAAAEAIGIDYCGVDLLQDREGYTVLEVNGTPNWHCMAAPIPRLLASLPHTDRAQHACMRAHRVREPVVEERGGRGPPAIFCCPPRPGVPGPLTGGARYL